MVCPYCAAETRVINSRWQKRNNQVWRRRKCSVCSAAFTSHESVYLPSVFIVDSNRDKIPFLPEILYQEVLSAVRDHKDSYVVARELTGTITQKVLKNASNGLILPQKISFEAGQVLKRFDKQAYLRFVAEHPSLQATSRQRRRVRS